MLLGTLRASLLENILADKGAIAKNHGQGINRAGEGIVRAGYGENKKTVKLIFKTINTVPIKTKSYCFKYRKDTENINQRVSKTK